jgi:hypothetical protein
MSNDQGGDAGAGQGAAQRERVTHLAGAVIAFNGFTMNGGFLDSVSSCEASLRRHRCGL